ncbi:MAG: AI-2E family transporter [Hyphomicrobiaceae bacterium]|nr:AI-2E family transporter [Hyphomicrobiaceae bacterium]
MLKERHVVFWLAAALLAALMLLLLREILLPFVAGLVIAYFLNPVVDALQRWGVPRGLGTLLIVGLAGLAFVAALVFLLPLLVDQVQRLATGLPSYLDQLRRLVEAWATARFGAASPAIHSGLEQVQKAIVDNWAWAASLVFSSVWSRGLALVNLVSLLLITPVVVFYLLADWPRMITRMDGWLPRDQAPTIRRLAGEMNLAVSAFIRGQGTICLILGCLYAFGLTFAGLRYGALIGVATGLLSFVPIVGWSVGFVTALGLAVAEFGLSWAPLAKVAGVFLAGQVLDTGFLSPRIVGKSVGLHPVWLMFALFVFSYLFGFVGVLLAVPLGAAIAVLVRFALEVYLASPIYRGCAPVETQGQEPARE